MATAQELQFGVLAVKEGFASTTEIDLALDAQREATISDSDTPRLGEILLEMGTLTQSQVETVLETQTRLRKGDTEPVPLIEAPKPEPPAPPPVEPLTRTTLVQESGASITVNDEPLASIRTLKAGDKIRVGDAVLQFTAGPSGAVEIDLKPRDQTTTATPVEAPAAAPAKPPITQTLLGFLGKIDALIARIPPASLHTQRKYALAGIGVAWLTMLLPWRIASNGNSVLGIQGPGWVTTLLLSIPLGIALLTQPSEPFTKAQRIASSAPSALAVLIGIWKLFSAPAYATGRGIGLFLSLIAAVGVLAAVAVARPPLASTSAASPTLGVRLGQAILKLFSNLSGKRAKELSASIEQRDALLRKLGEASLEANAGLPEASTAIQAKEALAKAEKDPGTEPNAQVRAKAAQKAADAKAKRAFIKLAQKAIEKGSVPDGEKPALEELKSLDEKIKKLS